MADRIESGADVRSCRWRRVAPGLYERIDTPRRVPISQRFADAAAREGNSLLVAILERAIREDEIVNLRKNAN